MTSCCLVIACKSHRTYDPPRPGMLVPWGRTWTHIHPHACVCAKSLQSCPTLCDPMDHSPPVSSVHGILQARIQKWVVISSSRGSSWPGDWTCISYISCIGAHGETQCSRQAGAPPCLSQGFLSGPQVPNIELAKKFIQVFHKMLWKTQTDFLVNPIEGLQHVKPHWMPPSIPCLPNPHLSLIPLSPGAPTMCQMLGKQSWN